MHSDCISRLQIEIPIYPFYYESSYLMGTIAIVCTVSRPCLTKFALHWLASTQLICSTVHWWDSVRWRRCIGWLMGGLESRAIS